RDEYYENYPYRALRELVLNAIMHRNYESNSPVYINEFDDRIEISNPGGLFGEVSPENFPDASSYRNPVISEVMRVLGYVNKYNFGIRFANQLLEKNGNGHAEFMINDPRRFSVTIKKSKIWLES
ncbi:MAG: transcriptional regulator, partial [Ignavibacteriaceae bacterium]|nr:transcriptional regulator [Ignavibacteriaceae bacterium]